MHPLEGMQSVWKRLHPSPRWGRFRRRGQRPADLPLAPGSHKDLEELRSGKRARFVTTL